MAEYAHRIHTMIRTLEVIDTNTDGWRDFDASEAQELHDYLRSLATDAEEAADQIADIWHDEVLND